jgi:ubiquinone/menaquinone biosynthesis C-methylase UbiE
MPTQEIPAAPGSYALGHDDAELARLEHQSTVWGAFTERFLREAGIERGMRVLDVGCGPGDVALLAARLVGPGGRVVGVDRSSDAVATATLRAARAALPWLEFRVGVAESLRAALGPGEGPLDAVVGRFILHHLREPATLLREAAALVRPGGIVAFAEYDFTLGGAVWPPVPLYTSALHRVIRALGAAGADMQIGCRLHRHFAEAGLPQPAVSGAFWVHPAAGTPAYRMVADVTRSLLPAIEAAGLGTAAEVDVDTLEERLRDAVTAAGASVRSPDLVFAWCHVPGA